MDILGFITVPDWLLIIIGLLVAGYVYYARKFSFWTSRGVKQPRPLPYLGNVFEMLTRPFHEVEMERYQKLGRIYGYYEGTKPILTVAEPELVRQILVKDFHIFQGRRKFPFSEPLFEHALSVISGERWKWMRAIVSQTFSSGKMRKIAPLINECADALQENLREAAEKNQPVDCKKILGAFTMDVIASCAFGTKIDSHRDPENPFVKYASQVFNFRLNMRMLLLFTAPRICALLRYRFIKEEISTFFCDITQRLIKERKEKKVDRTDFLQLLLDASELKDPVEEEELENSMENTFRIEKNANNGTVNFDIPAFKKALSEIDVLAQCFLFFVAGYETTATTLSFAFYYMALNPELQDKLMKEVDDIFEEYENVDYDTLAKMPYLDAFVSETLRMNPPAIRAERAAEEDYTLADTGIFLPKGSLVGIPVYAMHHDPEYFPDPEKFDPERFMPENRGNIIPYTYVPFGGGPRNCVALRFALMEAKLCIAKTLRHFRFSRCPETKVPLEYHAGAQLLQPGGIILKVEKRS